VDNIQVALIGQPNVGKSSLFIRMTGVGVITSNYPGTTVEFDEGTVTVGERSVHVRDCPGTYSLYANSDDERIVIDMLRDSGNDVIVSVADCTNLEPGLTLALEISELGRPMILVLNKYDIRRYEIDAGKLEDILGIPVVTVSSKTGEGVDTLMRRIAEDSARPMSYRVRYDGHIMGYVQRLTQDVPSLTDGIAAKLLEGTGEHLATVSGNVLDTVNDMREEFSRLHGEDIMIHMAGDRYADAHEIVINVTDARSDDISARERLSEMIITPRTGIPILIGVLTVTFCILVFAGGALSEFIEDTYESIVGTALIDLGRDIGGEMGAAIMAGIDISILAILGLVIPYIMIFYIVLGILEDSGYLPRAVVLLDRTMHRLGLHGNAFIPMMVGLGCNVPAILSTRVIRSRRERMILCTIICMAVPCSAQLATITGVTGRFAGAVWAFAVLGTLLIIGVAAGIILNRRLRAEPSNLAIELPVLQFPSLRNVLMKMWMRTSDFFKMAVPLLIIGSIILQILITYQVLDSLVDPMSWLTVGLLGLPAVTIISFIAGIVRKEMSYGMLVILSAAQGYSEITDFMTPEQFVVFGLVMAIYVPCLSTFAALYKEMGLKRTVIIASSAIAVAVAAGTLFHLLLPSIM